MSTNVVDGINSFAGDWVDKTAKVAGQSVTVGTGSRFEMHAEPLDYRLHEDATV
jgi:hypothetical protein